jgi:hypothetical protein
MSALVTTYGSLDDLVTATLADFARCGIDCLTKLALLEAAWNHTVAPETPDGYALCLGCSDAPETLRLYLDQLAASGLLICEGDCYRLTDSPTYGMTLSHLQAFWSNRELHARAAPLLRYRMA